MKATNLRVAFGSMFLVAVLAVAGCASVQIGTDFDLPTFVAKVQRGTTTKAAVKGWLGEPVSRGVEVDAQGRKFDQWTYYLGTGHAPSFQDTQFKNLQVKFDEHGVVQAYSWSGEMKK